MNETPDGREDRDEDDEDQRYLAVVDEPWRPPAPEAERYTIAVEWQVRATVRGDRYQDARRHVAHALLPAAAMTLRGALDAPADFVDRGAILWDYAPGEDEEA